VLLLTTGWVLSGVLVADDTPPLVVATGRVAASGVVLFGLALAGSTTRAAMIRVAARRATVVTLAFVGYFVYFVGTMLGVARIGASRTGLVVALLPCAAFLVGIVAFGEQATVRKAAGTAVAVAGAVGYAHVTSGRGTGEVDDFLIGGGWALLATVAFAVYNYLYRSTLHDVPPLGALPVLFGLATLMLVPVTVATEPLSAVTPRQWLGSVLLGAVFTAPVYVTAHELVLRRGPLYMAMVSLVVPFFVRIVEWDLGSAPPMDLFALVTMAVSLAGIVITVRGPRRQDATGMKMPLLLASSMIRSRSRQRNQNAPR
jgi:drug/metabolite transporter (DMT)-like permease